MFEDAANQRNVMPATLTKEQMEFLKSMDTPTVCNVIEMVAPERRGHGYTVKHLFCPFPDLPPSSASRKP